MKTLMEERERNESVLADILALPPEKRQDAVFDMLSFNSTHGICAPPKTVELILEKAAVPPYVSKKGSFASAIASNNSFEELDLPKEIIMRVAMASDLTILDSFGQSFLSLVLMNNSSQNLGLSRDDVMVIAERSNLRIQDVDGRTPLMCALGGNVSQKLGLSRDDVMAISERSDLTAQNVNGQNAAMHAVKLNKIQNLGLSVIDLTYLIEKGGIHSADLRGHKAISYLALSNESQELGFSKEDMTALFERSFPEPAAPDFAEAYLNWKAIPFIMQKAYEICGIPHETLVRKFLLIEQARPDAFKGSSAAEYLLSHADELKLDKELIRYEMTKVDPYSKTKNGPTLFATLCNANANHGLGFDRRELESIAENGEKAFSSRKPSIR